MTNLATLTRLAQAATPGKWKIHDQDITGVWRVEYPGTVYPSFVLGCYKGKADVDYIVATQPDVILTLVEKVRELERAARRMEQCVEMASKLSSWNFSVAQALIPGRDALHLALTPSEPT